MPVPTIRSLSTPGPQRSDPTTFPARGDLLASELPGLVSDMNAAIAAFNAQGFPTIRAALTANYTATNADNGKLFDCSGTFTLSYAAAASLAANWWCLVANNGSGNITHDPNGSETIDGATTGTQYPGFVMMIHCDGTVLRAYKLSGYRQELYTAGTTITAAMGIRSWKATLQGGGASGLASASTAGCGGPAGATAIKVFAVTPNTAYSCAIGSGGASAASGGGSSNAGGNTTLTVGGTTVTANGGPAAAGSGGAAQSTLGGTASNGDINIPGGIGFTTGDPTGGGSCIVSKGGDSALGQGGVCTGGSSVRAATGYGSGGPGTNSGTASGAGMQGCIVIEF